MKHIEMTSSSCCGCSACTMICSKNAIVMTEDDEGFKVPHVDENKCIDCGLCLKVCPALKCGRKDENDNIRAYAFKNLNDSFRNNSASGGLFPAFAQYFIQKLNGYVCGCILDENLNVVHVLSDKMSDVEMMQDSKYVQSDMNNCYFKIAEKLKEHFYVLFTGTSCQVQGLLSFLKIKHISTETLLTIDFFCHGVPSPKIWKDYVSLYEAKLGQHVEGYKFRNKTYGWGKGKESRGTGYLSTWKYSGAYHEQGSLLARIWPRIFFSNLCLRAYCHTCSYTSIYKPADLTMGDFWGIEEFRPDFNDHKGCSLLLVHNSKALNILEALDNVQILKVTIDEAIKRQSNAFKASKPHVLRAKFWRDYQLYGFAYILKYFNYTLMGRIKARVKYILFKLHLRKYSY